MIVTLNELSKNNNNTLEFTLDFSKEIMTSSSISSIGLVNVVGKYRIVDPATVRFNLEASFNVTIITADTLNPIEIPMHIEIIDDITSQDESEYKIVNGKINLYELVWGWVAAELPYSVFEH